MTKTKTQPSVRGKASSVGKKAYIATPGMVKVGKHKFADLILDEADGQRVITTPDTGRKAARTRRVTSGEPIAPHRRAVLPDNVVKKYLHLRRDMALAATLPLMKGARFNPDGLEQTPSAVASPYTVTAVDNTGKYPVTSVGTVLPPGTMMAAVTRDPLNAIVEWVPNAGQLPYNYTARFLDSDGVEQTKIPIFATTRINFAFFRDTHISNANYLHPNGDVYFPKTLERDTAVKLVYLNVSEDAYIGFFDGAGAPVNTTGNVMVHLYDGLDVKEHAVLSVASTYVVYAPSKSGWYSFTAGFPTPLVGATLIKFERRCLGGSTLPCGLIAHKPIPGFYDRLGITGLRVNGASIMITPDSAELAKGGLVVGNQVPSTYQVEAFFNVAAGGDPTESLFGMQGTWQHDFKHGAYAFHKADGPHCYAMQKPIRFGRVFVGGAQEGNTRDITEYFSPMTPPGGFLLLAARTPPAVVEASPSGSSTFPGAILHMTYAWSVEYTTNDIWINTKRADSDPEAYAAIMKLISTVPQFTENNFHVRDILRWLRSNVNTLGSEGQKYLQVFGPEVRRALEGILDTAERVAGKMAAF